MKFPKLPPVLESRTWLTGSTSSCPEDDDQSLTVRRLRLELQKFLAGQLRQELSTFEDNIARKLEISLSVKSTAQSSWQRPDVIPHRPEGNLCRRRSPDTEEEEDDLGLPLVPRTSMQYRSRPSWQSSRLSHRSSRINSVDDSVFKTLSGLPTMDRGRTSTTSKDPLLAKLDRRSVKLQFDTASDLQSEARKSEDVTKRSSTDTSFPLEQDLLELTLPERDSISRSDTRRGTWAYHFRKGSRPQNEEDYEDDDDDEHSNASQEEVATCERSRYSDASTCTMQDVVHSKLVVYSVAFMVVLNSITIGVQTDYMARNWLAVIPPPFSVMEKVFCFFFLLEIIARFFAAGPRSFLCDTQQWKWNMFDLVIVIMQVSEEVFSWNSGGQLMHHKWSTLRMLRLLRIMRLARILNLITELRVLVVSIYASIRSLTWVILLLVMMAYVMAVYLTQLVTDLKVQKEGEFEEKREILLFFGTLDRSMLSLYMMISEGIHWEKLMQPLSKEVSPWIRLLFCVFSAIAIFAVLNVVTGVFVESAIHTAMEDKKVALTMQMRKMFKQADDDNSGEISWTEFEAHLEEPQMQACLKELNVDMGDAHELFRLLDINGSGSIDADELVNGSLLLMGTAKSIDLASFMREYRSDMANLDVQIDYMCECLRYLLTSRRSVSPSARTTNGGPAGSQSQVLPDSDLIVLAERETTDKGES